MCACRAAHLPAEGAGVFGVLADLDLLHHLPERRTVAGAVLPHNPHLLSALGLSGNTRQHFNAHALSDQSNSSSGNVFEDASSQ